MMEAERRLVGGEEEEEEERPTLLFVFGGCCGLTSNSPAAALLLPFSLAAALLPHPLLSDALSVVSHALFFIRVLALVRCGHL